MAGAELSYTNPFMHSMSIDRDEQSLRAMTGYGRNVLCVLAGARYQKQLRKISIAQKRWPFAFRSGVETKDAVRKRVTL